MGAGSVVVCNVDMLQTQHDMMFAHDDVHMQAKAGMSKAAMASLLSNVQDVSLAQYK